MRHTIEEYRTLFSVIPTTFRRRAIGKSWEETNQLHWASGRERDRVPTPRYQPGRECFCPLGLVLETVDRCPTTPGPMAATERINTIATKKRTAMTIDVPFVGDFMRDWDEGQMTVEEMEAIFS